MKFSFVICLVTLSILLIAYAQLGGGETRRPGGYTQEVNVAKFLSDPDYKPSFNLAVRSALTLAGKNYKYKAVIKSLKHSIVSHSFNLNGIRNELQVHIPLCREKE